MKRLLPALAACAGFLPYFQRRGFYADDWTQMISHPGGSYFYSRPLNLLYYPLLYRLFGLSAWKYQLLYVAFAALGATFLYEALRRAWGEDRLPLLAAVLFALYPNHDGSRFWNNQIHPSQLLFCASMLAYSCRRRGWSTLLFVLAGLNYEAFVPLCVMAPLLGAMRGDKRPVRDAWPLFLSAALLLAYCAVIQRLYPNTVTRGMTLDWRLAWSVLAKGLECSSTSILHLLARSWRLFKPWFALAALAWALPLQPGKPTRLWVWGGLLLFVAGYAPYMISAEHYIPHIFDYQNRLNAASSLGAAMLLAAALRRRAAIAAVLAVFLVLDWHACRQWGEGGLIQRRVIADLRRELPKIKERPAVVVSDAPQYVGGALVFVNDVEFNAGVKALVDPALHGAMAAEGRSVLATLPPEEPRYYYRYASGFLQSIP